MKKFLAMLLAAMMLFSFAAIASAEEEAGFDEMELGVEGEQEIGFMTMSMVYFQPVDMAPVENATPAEGSDLHIEVDLTANENPYAFPVDAWVPYLSIDFVIKDTEGKEVYSGSMMPMAASDGPHYGNNIPLANGEYTITLYIKSPAENGYLLHVDAETGVEADSFWTEPLEATWTGWTFEKAW
ncbi:MAG: iron transporter [Clostridia bacterium]|nr:iron transporter [Clostridia bacterium]